MQKVKETIGVCLHNLRTYIHTYVVWEPLNVDLLKVRTSLLYNQDSLFCYNQCIGYT